MSENENNNSTPVNGGIVARTVPMLLEHEMSKSFIAYAMAVITDRALPDVRDGLKPVHRRILYSMSELGLQPDKPFRKSARIVGDVLGKYHPHGDVAVYDAMVRLAQPFNTRYLLVEGHGNFGSVDGDGAAAMRYTEARLSKLATEMMADIDKDTVEFVPNFDETLQQPAVLPARFPNLLVNGSGGIAVGMATNIPPHNLGEVTDALCAMIDNPDITVDDLMQYIPGPDFPTGGIIMGRMGVAEAYRTGRGRIVVRAKTEIEQMSANRSRIIVTEIPYQVNKARLVERIAELVKEKKIEGISDLRDETDREGTRIVIELKRDVNAQVVLNNLYKHTALQDTFGAILLALVDGEPRVLNLRDMLYYYLEHQKDVVTRRTRFDLNRALERLHILEGLIIATDNIDEVVQIVKTSTSAQEAKARLTERFGLTERQGQAILDMRLQRLVGLERDKLHDEEAALKVRVEELQDILSDEHKLMGIVKEEAKRISPDVYRTQNRGGRGVMGHSTKEEDFVERMFVTSTHSDLFFYTTRGRVFKVRCYAIPETGRASKGVPVVNLVQLQDGEKVTAMYPGSRNAETDHRYLVTATRQGLIKKTRISECSNIRKGGLLIQSILEGDELMSVEVSSGEDEFLISSRKGKCIRFSEADVRATGRGGQGVRSIRLDDGDEVVDMVKIVPGGALLTVTERGMGKRTDEEQYRAQGRGGKGITAMNLTEKTGDLACCKMTQGDEDMMLVRDDGTIIRTPVSQVPNIGRATQGVRLMRVDEGTRVVCVALAPHAEEEAEEGAAPEPQA